MDVDVVKQVSRSSGESEELTGWREKNNLRNRNRGGIFVPPTTNSLIDLLLGKGKPKNPFSVKAPGSRRLSTRIRPLIKSSRKSTAGRKSKKQLVDASSPIRAPEPTNSVLTAVKGKRKAKTADLAAPKNNKPKKTKSRKTANDSDEESELKSRKRKAKAATPLSGDDAEAQPSTSRVLDQKSRASTKQTKVAASIDVEDLDDGRPSTSARKRKRPAPTPAEDKENEEPEDAGTPPKKRKAAKAASTKFESTINSASLPKLSKKKKLPVFYPSSDEEEIEQPAPEKPSKKKTHSLRPPTVASDPVPLRETGTSKRAASHHTVKSNIQSASDIEMPSKSDRPKPRKRPVSETKADSEEEDAEHGKEDPIPASGVAGKKRKLYPITEDDSRYDAPLPEHLESSSKTKTAKPRAVRNKSEKPEPEAVDSEPEQPRSKKRATTSSKNQRPKSRAMPSSEPDPLDCL